MLYKTLLLLIISIFAFNNIYASESNNSQKSFYVVPIKTRNDLKTFDDAQISILHRKQEGVIVHITQVQKDKLIKAGFKPSYLDRDPALPASSILKSDTFHDNEDINSIFSDLVSNYPSLCERFTVGYSIENRPLYGLKISNSQKNIANKVEIRVAGAIHGNEIMSVEIPLLMAQYLLENYTTDNTVKDLVDSIEFYMIPLVNPDGRNSKSRYNKNSIDLNRNFGYQYHPGNSNGDTKNSGMFSQPETYAMAKHHLERNFTLSFIFHTVAAYVNYFWNFAERETPDESLVAELATRYADRSPYNATQGFDWYQTYGDLNDFSYGSKGGFDYTIETENENTSTIASVWNNNREALLDAFQQVKRGLHGVITDSESGDKIEAMILCDDPFWPVYSDSEFGDYHRILEPGTYSCTYIAPGYKAERVENIVIENTTPTIEDVALTYNGKYYGFLIPATTTSYTNITYSPAALGEPDDNSYSLTTNGNVVIDMAVEMSGYGNTLKVHEGYPNENEEYKIYVGKDFIGPWVYLGYASGNSEFDLSGLGNDTARYVKIVDNGTESSSPYIGFDLDAVEYIINQTADGDEDMDNEVSCTKPFDCLDIHITRETDCSTANIQSKVTWSENCTMTMKLLPFCGEGDSQYLSLSPDENGFSGTQNCTLQNTDGSLWEMQGECGFYHSITANVHAIECDNLSNESQLISSTCNETCIEDGDNDIDNAEDDYDLDSSENDINDNLTDGDDDSTKSESSVENEDNNESEEEWSEGTDSVADGDYDEYEDNGSGSGGGCNNTAHNESALLLLLIISYLFTSRARKNN